MQVMGDSYERVKSDETAHAMFEQARVIVQWERVLLGTGLWQNSDPKCFPRYMTIAEEVQGQGVDRIMAEGVTGRMRSDLRASTAHKKLSPLGVLECFLRHSYKPCAPQIDR